MHQPALGPHAPQRRCPHFAGGVRRPVLNNAVTGADVMQQEIAIRMNGLTAQCGRHGKSAFIEPAQFSRVR